jgi:hypothetical protein
LKRLGVYEAVEVGRSRFDCPLRSSRRGIEAAAHLLASLEDGHNFLCDLNEITRLGIAARASATALHPKRAEATKLDSVASCEGITNGAEDGVHNFLDISLIQVRVLLSESLDEFGFDHVWRRSLFRRH